MTKVVKVSKADYLMKILVIRFPASILFQQRKRALTRITRALKFHVSFSGTLVIRNHPGNFGIITISSFSEVTKQHIPAVNIFSR